VHGELHPFIALRYRSLVFRAVCSTLRWIGTCTTNNGIDDTTTMYRHAVLSALLDSIANHPEASTSKMGLQLRVQLINIITCVAEMRIDTQARVEGGGKAVAAP
jgi:hypothetical protein